STGQSASPASCQPHEMTSQILAEGRVSCLKRPRREISGPQVRFLAALRRTSFRYKEKRAGECAFSNSWRLVQAHKALLCPEINYSGRNATLISRASLCISGSVCLVDLLPHCHDRDE